MQVFLIRHTRPRLAAGVCYGQLDVDCEDPLPAARRLRPRIPPDTPIFCSPLRRARVLAEALIEAGADSRGGLRVDSQADALPRAPRIDARLCEIAFGEWEGKTWAEIGRASLDAWAADVLHFTPPGGESVAQLRARVIEFADTLALPRVAIVSHAGVMKTLCGYWQGLPDGEWSRLEFPFGELCELMV